MYISSALGISLAQCCSQVDTRREMNHINENVCRCTVSLYLK